MSTRSKRHPALPKTFEALVRLHMPRAVRNQALYRKTQELIDRLTSTTKLSAGQEEYLDTLTILFEAYEQKHERWGQTDRSPSEAEWDRLFSDPKYAKKFKALAAKAKREIAQGKTKPLDPNRL